MTVRATLRWIALAVLGLVIAAGVAIAAGRLSAQQIGLASEPIFAGDALAPPKRAPARNHHRHSRPHRHASPTTPAPSVTPPAVSPASPTEISPAPAAPSSPEPRGGGDGEGGGGPDD